MSKIKLSLPKDNSCFKDLFTALNLFQISAFFTKQYIVDGYINVDLSLKTSREGQKHWTRQGMQCGPFGDDKVRKSFYYDMFYGDIVNYMKLVIRLTMEK